MAHSQSLRGLVNPAAATPEGHVAAIVLPAPLSPAGGERGDELSWSLLARSSSYSPSLDICRLCLLEKHLLMKHPALGTLNVEDEFYATCRHKSPLLLSSIK